MSKSRAFGSQVVLQFSLNGGTTVFNIAEIDQFSFKIDDVVKENSSLGEVGIGTMDVLQNGGTLSFEAKKSDSALIHLFQTLENHHRALENNGTRGRTPYFTVKRVLKYTDGTIETKTFKKVVLHSPEESVSDNKSEITEKFEGKFIKTSTDYKGSGDASILSDISKGLVNSGLAYLTSVGEQNALSYVPS